MSAVSSSLRSSSHHQNGSGNNSSSKHRDSRRRERTGMAAEEANDNSNLVKLCINKPKDWNWELTTSKSSPSIAFPIIQLYDKKSGELLAETNEADCQIRGRGAAAAGVGGSSRASITNSNSNSSGIIRRKNGSSVSRRCATTTNIIPEIIAESRDEELLSSSGQLPLKVSHCRSKSWQNDEISRGSDKCKARSRSSSVNRKLASLDELLNGVVDQYAREGVQCKLTYHGSRRGSCERKVDSPKLDEQQQQRWTNNYALGKSKSSTYVPVIAKTTSNSSCVSSDRKKKYRRAHSVNSLRFSNSILERIREYKRSSSTSSSEGEDEVDLGNSEETTGADDQPGNLLSPTGTLRRNKLRMVHSATDIAGEKSIQATEEDVYRPKYTLRTSKAGTIVVCEESFRHRKVRRRPRSLTRSEERKDGEDYVVFSPEKVKTKFEYIGRAENEEAENAKKGEPPIVGEAANRYQREIDNIDKMILEKLKTEKVTGGKSTQTRRHKSLVDRASATGIDEVVGRGGIYANIMDFPGAACPVRYPSHRSDDLSTAVDGADRCCQKAVDTKEKRISFGETTRFSRSTDYEECGGDDATRIDINDVDNLGRSTRRYHDDFHREVIDGEPRPTGTTQSHHAAASDKDKCCPPLLVGGQQRKQVRRTRRSLSADYPTPRLNDLLLSSSTEEEKPDEDKEQRKNRGRSRTRKRRTPTTSEERETKTMRTTTAENDKEQEGRTHKLIVQGKPKNKPTNQPTSKRVAGLPMARH